MDKVKVSGEYRSEPNLQKLARALISIARRQLADEAAHEAEAAETATMKRKVADKPSSSKDAA